METSSSITELRHVLAQELNAARKLARLFCGGWDDYHRGLAYRACRQKVRRAIEAAKDGRTVHIRRYAA